VQLGHSALSGAYRLEYFSELDSTNTRAMDEARNIPADVKFLRKWFIAGRQNAGRGRMARPWVSEPGNLYASLLLLDGLTPARAAELGFVAGVALAEALSPMLPQVAQPKLKWPNDLLCNGAKVAGILLEATTLPDGRFVCVIGCGVNCVSHPADTPYPAASLHSLGAAASPAEVFASWSNCFADRYMGWRDAGGFSAIRMAWLSHAAHLGQSISIALNGETIQGIFRTIDEHGRLVLEQPDGFRIIDTGDIMLTRSETAHQEPPPTGH
jgi:BirA family biotin operon repressor/biotin-[acetyl-CoA-carboxylase] ligase